MRSVEQMNMFGIPWAGLGFDVESVKKLHVIKRDEGLFFYACD